jgi:probable rRNA maturation factor
MILDRQRTVRVALRPLESFLSRVRNTLRLQKTDATICLVSDAEIARMNEAFRKKRGPTDVLSFPAFERHRPAGLKYGRRAGALGKRSRDNTRKIAAVYLGDIAISPATARRNAKQDGRALQTELQILILHGVLHLLGYDHETDRGQMKRLEQQLRQRFGLA